VRILLALHGLAVEGGIASVSRSLVRALDELLAAGSLERVDRVLLAEDPAHPHPPPLRGVQRYARHGYARFVWETWRACVAHRPDLLLFDHLGMARTLTLPLPGLRRARTAVIVHGTELAAVTPGSACERVLRGAWRIVTNSRFTGRRVAKLVPAAAERVRPVQLCIDPVRLEAWTREAPPCGPRECAALLVGRMAKEERLDPRRGKGHEHVLRAWPEVRRRVPGAELWIVGGGDDREALEALARDLGQAEAVRFLGRVDDDALAALYRRARVFVMPSQQEGFGLVYAEAMLQGLPVIASTADAAPEVVGESGECGRLVPYGDVRAISDAVASILGDLALASRLGAAARERALSHFVFPEFRRDVLAALELPTPSRGT
jgi:phosphatidylinositol alpha-1,6-mannosyltransferase